MKTKAYILLFIASMLLFGQCYQVGTPQTPTLSNPNIQQREKLILTSDSLSAVILNNGQNANNPTATVVALEGSRARILESDSTASDRGQKSSPLMPECDHLFEIEHKHPQEDMDQDLGVPTVLNVESSSISMVYDPLTQRNVILSSFTYCGQKHENKSCTLWAFKRLAFENLDVSTANMPGPTCKDKIRLLPDFKFTTTENTPGATPGPTQNFGAIFKANHPDTWIAPVTSSVQIQNKNSPKSEHGRAASWVINVHDVAVSATGERDIAIDIIDHKLNVYQFKLSEILNSPNTARAHGVIRVLRRNYNKGMYEPMDQEFKRDFSKSINQTEKKMSEWIGKLAKQIEDQRIWCKAGKFSVESYKKHQDGFGHNADSDKFSEIEGSDSEGKNSDSDGEMSGDEAGKNGKPKDLVCPVVEDKLSDFPTEVVIFYKQHMPTRVDPDRWLLFYKVIKVLVDKDGVKAPFLYVLPITKNDEQPISWKTKALQYVKSFARYDANQRPRAICNTGWKFNPDSQLCDIPETCYKKEHLKNCLFSKTETDTVGQFVRETCLVCKRYTVLSLMNRCVPWKTKDHPPIGPNCLAGKKRIIKFFQRPKFNRDDFRKWRLHDKEAVIIKKILESELKNIKAYPVPNPTNATGFTAQMHYNRADSFWTRRNYKDWRKDFYSRDDIDKKHTDWKSDFETEDKTITGNFYKWWRWGFRVHREFDKLVNYCRFELFSELHLQQDIAKPIQQGWPDAESKCDSLFGFILQASKLEKSYWNDQTEGAGMKHFGGDCSKFGKVWDPEYEMTDLEIQQNSYNDMESGDQRIVINYLTLGYLWKSLTSKLVYANWFSMYARSWEADSQGSDLQSDWDGLMNDGKMNRRNWVVYRKYRNFLEFREWAIAKGDAMVDTADNEFVQQFPRYVVKMRNADLKIQIHNMRRIFRPKQAQTASLKHNLKYIYRKHMKTVNKFIWQLACPDSDTASHCKEDVAKTNLELVFSEFKSDLLEEVAETFEGQNPKT